MIALGVVVLFAHGCIYCPSRLYNLGKSGILLYMLYIGVSRQSGCNKLK